MTLIEQCSHIETHKQNLSFTHFILKLKNCTQNILQPIHPSFRTLVRPIQLPHFLINHDSFIIYQGHGDIRFVHSNGSEPVVFIVHVVEAPLIKGGLGYGTESVERWI